MAATPLKTTVVGSMKKPSYLNIPSWADNDIYGWGKKNPNLATNGHHNEAEVKRKEELEKELLEQQIMQVILIDCKRLYLEYQINRILKNEGSKIVGDRNPKVKVLSDSACSN